MTPDPAPTEEARAVAARFAHRLNNPLAAVLTNLEFVAQDLERLKADASRNATDAWVGERVGEIQEPLRDVLEAADHIRRITRELQDLAR